jgi:hypothetical protein
MIKITKGHNQYVLNSDTGLIIVFETVAIHYEMTLVLKREIYGKSVGIATLMDGPMNEALKQMHELGIKVFKHD